MASIAPMPKDKKSTDKKKQKDERSPEQRESDTAAKKAAKEARKAEKAAAKAAEEAARAADKSAKREAKKAAKAGGAPSFKHVRKKKLASGKGPTPQEIGESLVALFNAGKSDEAESTWYHRKIESIEDDGSVFKGWKGVQEKGKWWKENFTALSMRATALYVCSTGFTVVYIGRVRMSDGTETDVRECGVYTVEDGRIVREQFMKCMGAE